MPERMNPIEQIIKPFTPHWWANVTEDEFVICVESPDTQQVYVLAAGLVEDAIADPWKVRATSMVTYWFLSGQVALPNVVLTPDLIDEMRKEVFVFDQPSQTVATTVASPLDRFTLGNRNMMGAVQIRHAPAMTPVLGSREEDGMVYEEIQGAAPRVGRRLDWGG